MKKKHSTQSKKEDDHHKLIHFNRGIQIASGRFGITAETINVTNLIEIKVGQGAKPGEGGHLPARKVTQKVADARHAQNGEIVIRPMMYVALSYDHRIVDGREAVQFLVHIKQLLEDPAWMLVEG